VVARAIHEANQRGQFVPIDCGALVGTLMESELFGQVKGSFGGAMENKKGLVELADGGTAFFDEIGDLPLEIAGQAAAPDPGARVSTGWRASLAQHRPADHRRHAP
jgi:transcriptional regulator with GAF, ATPase, and Fis domain